MRGALTRIPATCAAIGPIPQRLPDGQADGIGDEVDVSVDKSHVHPARMPAPRCVVPQVNIETLIWGAGHVRLRKAHARLANVSIAAVGAWIAICGFVEMFIERGES